MKNRTNIFWILFVLAFGCVEESINDPINLQYNLTGKIYSSSSSYGVPGIEIFLKGVSTIVDTTSLSGHYSFLDVPKGEYHLLINDHASIPIDTVVALSKDTTLNFMLESNIISDYFPLVFGNWWEYDFLFYPRASDWLNHWLKGKIKWTIIDEIELVDSTKYIVERTINGIEIKYNMDTSENDTTFIIDRREEIKFVECDDVYVAI